MSKCLSMPRHQLTPEGNIININRKTFQKTISGVLTGASIEKGPFPVHHVLFFYRNIKLKTGNNFVSTVATFFFLF